MGCELGCEKDLQPKPRRRRELVLVQSRIVRLPVLVVPRWRDDCGFNGGVRLDRLGRVIHPPGNKGRKYPPTPPPADQVPAILDAFPLDTKIGRRNRAITVVLWRTGLRISEALDLLPADIDLVNHVVTVRCGKGSKRRLVGIDEHACRELVEWLDERAWHGCRAHEPVFCSMHAHRRGRPMSSGTYREALHRAAARAGVTTRTAPHQLRHAMAVELSREGVSIPLLSRQLGHSNIATTSTYLAGISPVEVIDAMAARKWPGQTKPVLTHQAEGLTPMAEAMFKALMVAYPDTMTESELALASGYAESNMSRGRGIDVLRANGLLEHMWDGRVRAVLLRGVPS